MELNHRFNTFPQDVQRDVFVGRMDGVGLQAESHQYGFYSQYLFKGRDDRNTAAAAHCQRFLSECFGEAFLRRLICREGDGAYVSLSAMHGSDLYLYGVGGYAHDVIGKQMRDLMVVLMRNQPARYFGVCFGRQYGLGAFARIAAPNAAYVE